MAEITSDSVFDAVSILIDKKLETMKFDETISAKIVDDTNRSKGEYTILIDNVKCKAYSASVDYRNDDMVMVTVPQGNYDNQKIIIGKCVKDSNTPMSYKSPFSYFINLTGNLLAKNTNTYSLTANKEWIECLIEKGNELPSDSDTVQYYIKDNKQYVPITSWEINNNEDIIVYKKLISVKHINNLKYQNYTRLGVQAQFCSWLGDYDTVEGHYGLSLILTLQSLADSSQNTNITLDFNSNDFIGNIYNFQTYYTQQGVFDISKYAKDYKITNIEIKFYQGNDFKDSSGNPIPSSESNNNIFEDTIGPNLFVKDIFIALGIDTVDFVEDEVLLYSDNKLNYAKYPDASDRDEYNQKLAIARWIHKDEENDEIYSLSFDDEVPDKYEIRWYHKRIGAPSPDAFAGAHWERYYGQSDNADDNGDWLRPEWLLVTLIEDNQIYYRYDEENNQYVIVNIDELLQKDEEDHFIYNSEYQGFKKQDIEEYISLYLFNDNATNKYQVEFQPNVNNQTEELKVIILKNENGQERFIAASNLLTFTNDDEVRNKQTIIDANALSIRYEDDEKGHYFLYNEAGDIGKNEDTEIRTLTAVFGDNINNINEKSALNVQDCSSIVWTFPTGNTMIVPMNNISLEGVNQVNFVIKSHLDNNATNNTIRLDIVKDGLNYSAQVQPIFGTAGTNGSDYTVVLTWLDGKNAVDIGGDKTLRGEIAIYDQAGNIQPWPANTQIDYAWEVSYCQGTTTLKEKEEEEIFYPVFTSFNQALNYVNDNINRPYGYYYYIHDDDIYGEPNNDYYWFNPVAGVECFVKVDNWTTTKQLYVKGSKPQLEYKKVHFNREILNQETGNINYGVNNDNTVAIVKNNDLLEYYYSSTRKYYIKYKEQYILDPWPTYQEVETYFEPIQKAAKQFVANIATNKAASLLQATINNNIIEITGTSEISMNSLYILKIIIKNFGDTDLITYYPIPLKNNTNNLIVDFIEGPDRVRYGSSGETDFNKNPYQISCRQNINNVYSTIRHGYTDVTELAGYWQLIFAGDIAENFKPVLRESRDELATGHYDKPYLEPVSVYIPDASPYGVQFIYNGNPIWTQPILVYQNKYPSRTLNKWNGKDISTDKDAGTIVASGFAAGRKERDNTFTGTVIGDWSRSTADVSITKNTGIYGFNHGAMSYAFKDDGTGFIGKDGRGRIYLDGDKSQIYSSNWANINEPQGMLLDIDDGYIKMQKSISFYNYALVPQSTAETNLTTDFNTYKNQYYYYTNGNYILISDNPDFIAYNANYTYYIRTVVNSSAKYITLGVNQSTYPLSVGTTSNINNRKFKVAWDGTVYIQDGHFAGTITGSAVYTTYLSANLGEIGGWTINQSQLSSSDNQTILYSNPNSSNANIKTNVIDIVGIGSWSGKTARFGTVQGRDTNSNTTYGLGILSSSENTPLIFQSDGNNSTIAVRTKNSAFLEGGYSNHSTSEQPPNYYALASIEARYSGTIYLMSKANSSINSNIIISKNPAGDPIAGAFKVYATDIHFDTGSNATTAAEHQHGIYARFA